MFFRRSSTPLPEEEVDSQRNEAGSSYLEFAQEAEAFEMAMNIFHDPDKKKPDGILASNCTRTSVAQGEEYNKWILYLLEERRQRRRERKTGK